MLSALSQAWASWKTAPGVALLAVVAFAVGIGSATAIFTVINGVLLRPLPYPDGERFVSLYSVNTTNPGSFNLMSVPELQDYQQQTTSFDAFGWFRGGQFRLTAPGEPQFVRETLDFGGDFAFHLTENGDGGLMLNGDRVGHGI